MILKDFYQVTRGEKLSCLESGPSKSYIKLRLLTFIESKNTQNPNRKLMGNTSYSQLA